MNYQDLLKYARTPRIGSSRRTPAILQQSGQGAGTFHIDPSQPKVARAAAATRAGYRLFNPWTSGTGNARNYTHPGADLLTYRPRHRVGIGATGLKTTDKQPSGLPSNNPMYYSATGEPSLPDEIPHPISDVLKHDRFRPSGAKNARVTSYTKFIPYPDRSTTVMPPDFVKDPNAGEETTVEMAHWFHSQMPQHNPHKLSMTFNRGEYGSMPVANGYRSHLGMLSRLSKTK